MKVVEPSNSARNTIGRRSSLKVLGVCATASTFIRDQLRASTVAIAAVDSVDARRDVTDSLARTSLNAGVDGLRLHVSRHGFGDTRACLYCQYVDLGETIDECGMYVELTGIRPDRIRQLLDGETMTAADIQTMVASRRLVVDRHQASELVGGRLQDAVRGRLYAQAAIPNGTGALAVSAPFVSALAGSLLAAELLKDSKYFLNSRVDVDCSGLPTGFTSQPGQDPSGRCLCHDSIRLNAYRGHWASTVA